MEDNVYVIVYIAKVFIISMYTYFFNIKILNLNITLNVKQRIIVLCCTLGLQVFLSIAGKITQVGLNSVMYSTFIVAAIFSNITKNKFGYSLLISAISLSINQIAFFIATVLGYIPYRLFGIDNEYMNFIIIILIYSMVIIACTKVKRIKNGFSFLSKNKSNDFFNIIVLSCSIIILFTAILLSNYNKNMTVNFMLALVIFAIIIIITIQKSLQLYYKQKM